MRGRFRSEAGNEQASIGWAPCRSLKKKGMNRVGEEKRIAEKKSQRKVKKPAQEPRFCGEEYILQLRKSHTL